MPMVSVLIISALCLTVVYHCFWGVGVDLENWNGTDRHHFNAVVSDQDLVEVIMDSDA